MGRFAGKPILPITAFDGAAKEAFDYEWDRFDEVYSGRVQRDEYSMLDSALPEDFDGLAHDVVLLATKIVTGSNVFVVMSFRRESDDTWGTIDRVCKLYRFDAERTDQDPTTDRIYQRIVEGIQRASFVIADVTFPSLNVYFELGFAEALGKDVVVIAKTNEGSDLELPFDTNDIPTMAFVDQTRLEDALSSRIERLTGRRPTPA